VSIWQAVALAALQGLTEFLPVSSSGHLVIVPAFLGWPAPSLAFVVAVHVGTLLAVVGYYRRELGELLGGVGAWVARGRKRPWPPEVRLALALLLATVPAAAVGLGLEKQVEKVFNSAGLVGIALVATGLLLFAAARSGRERPLAETLSWAKALVVGCAQAVAIVPGISRSGTTIAAGLLCGWPCEWAVRFAFLLSVPVIAGAGLEQAVELSARGVGGHDLVVLGLGLAVSSVSGWAAIHLVIQAVRGRKLWWFGAYCLAVGVLTAVLYYGGLLRPAS
jgi:undecaprenyl-diphosphatase